MEVVTGRPEELPLERLAKVDVGDVDPGNIQHRRHNVEQLDHLFDHVAFGAAGSADDQRHPGENILQPRRPLLDQTVVACVIAVVGLRFIIKTLTPSQQRQYLLV